jgi:hypothetical protein
MGGVFAALAEAQFMAEPQPVSIDPTIAAAL